MNKTNNIDFTDDDIRPAEFQEDGKLNDIIDTGRLLTRRSEFVEVSCPACGSNDYRLCFYKNSLRYVDCTCCETMYISPRPPPEVLSWFYRGSFTYAYWNEYVFPASEEKRREKIFVPRVDRTLKLCEKYGIETDSLLEIGCAFGTYCMEMKSRNRFKRVIGLEATPELVKTCREKGIEVIEGLIENITFPKDGMFDVIANFEVIEHLFSPKEFICQCYNLLKPGGLFLVTCPNVKGFEFKVLGEKCNSIDHEHLNYLNLNSLELLLIKQGFRVKETLTPGRLDVELVRNKVLSGEFKLQGQPFLDEIIVHKWEELGTLFQDFLSKNKLSSHMWMVAQKGKSKG